MNPLSTALMSALALAAPLVHAQAPFDACLSIQQDAARLACYDQAAGREAVSPVEADAAAGEALQALQAERPEASVLDTLGRLSGTLVFQSDSHDPQLQAIANVGRGSLLDSRWELAADSKLGLFNLRPYKPVYVLPAFWSSNPNESPTPSGGLAETIENIVNIDDLEAKFQISMKTKLLENLIGTNGDLWLGYTQSSRWQVFNSDNSSPFRETNYEPELLLVFRNNYGIGDWRGRMTGIGINHQSNGRGDPISRSWNRVTFNFGLDRENWAVMIRPWIRLSDDPDEDDNPDISDYLGRGDVTVTRVRGPHRFTLMGRHTLRGGSDSRGALQFDWGHRIHNDLRFHMQVFHGYGESLIDYNQKATYVGIGLSLVDWF